ncbi:MAG: hypothetical protein ACJ0BK_01965 [Coraliomargaritaceae bacterium]
MSFVLLLLLSITSLIQVEAINASRALDQLRARESARLGLMVAVGDLTKNIEPDRRVTARADIIASEGVQTHSEHWTGVWNTADTDRSPVWLVSGEQPLPTTPLNDDNSIALEIFEPDATGNLPPTAARQTRAPKVLIESERSPGEFAYWISDEGLKASIVLPDRWFGLDLKNYEDRNFDFNSGSTWRRERTRKMSGAIFNIRSDLENTLGSGAVNSPLTHFVSNPDDPQDDGIITFSNFERSLTLSDLALGALDLPEEYLDFRAPDYTTINYFTLTNTLDGGFRQDLSQMRRMYDSLAGATPSQTDLDLVYSNPQWDYLTPEVYKFINFDRDHNFDPLTTPQAIEPSVPDDFKDLDVAFPTAPIVTEFIWNAGLGVRSLTGGKISRDVYLYFYSVGELLNPFGFPLALDNETGAYPGDFSDILLRISNLPTITIKNLDSGSVPVEIDLSDLVIATGINSWYNHNPGYMRPNFAPTGGFKSAISGNTRVGVFAVKIGELAVEPDSVRDDFRVDFGISDVAVEIRESNTNEISDNTDREQWAFFMTGTPKAIGVPRFDPANDPTQETKLVQKITLKNWGGFSIRYEGDVAGGSNATRFVRGGTAMKRNGSGGLNDGIVNFGIRGKFVDEWVESLASANEQPLSQLLTLADPRMPLITVDMNKPFDGDGEFYDIFPPRGMDRSEFVRSDDFFQGAEFGNDDNNRDSRIFDAPTQEPISVASLNDLYFKGFPYKPLGNKLEDRSPPLLPPAGPDTSLVDGNLPGKSLNNFFDRYFFSTIPTTSSDWNQKQVLPNQKIVFADNPDELSASVIRSNLESQESAKHLLIEGGFNINSTSEAAWEALLNLRQISEFSYTRSGDTPEKSRRLSAQNVERLFYSRPFSGDKSIESQAQQYDFIRANLSGDLAEDILTKGPHEAYIQGLRELSAPQIRDLAREIVKEIKVFGNREGRAFLSLTEFLNEGILQTAIDAVSSINRPNGKPIPTMAPAYFTSGMILNATSHYLFARSDTFKIRVTANANDQITGEVLSSASLEATVQRFPDSNSDGRSEIRIVRLQQL